MNKPQQKAKVPQVTPNETATVESKPMSTFITLNTENVKGIRLNLSHVVTYAPNNENVVTMTYINGSTGTFRFASKALMEQAIEELDARCL